MFTKTIALALTVLLGAAACSSAESTTTPEAEAGPPDTTEQSAPASQIRYAMADSGSTQWTVDPTRSPETGKFELSPAEPATPENQAVYDEAMLVMSLYLAEAWTLPFETGETDWDRIGQWARMLDESADDKWALGPTYLGTSNTSYDVPSPDVRIAQWNVRRDVPLEERRQPVASYDYLITRLNTSTTSETGGLVPLVLIDRSASGALEAVYVQWGAELGYTSGNPALENPREVSINVGTAKLIPAGGDEGDLRIASLDVGDLGGVMTFSIGSVIVNDGYNGRWSAEKPGLVFPDRIALKLEQYG